MCKALPKWSQHVHGCIRSHEWPCMVHAHSVGGGRTRDAGTDLPTTGFPRHQPATKAKATRDDKRPADLVRFRAKKLPLEGVIFWGAFVKPKRNWIMIEDRVSSTASANCTLDKKRVPSFPFEPVTALSVDPRASYESNSVAASRCTWYRIVPHQKCPQSKKIYCMEYPFYLTIWVSYISIGYAKLVVSWNGNGSWGFLSTTPKDPITDLRNPSHEVSAYA